MLKGLATDWLDLDQYRLWTALAVSGLVTIDMILIVAVFGTGQPTEVMAATRGLGVIVLWWFVLATAMQLSSNTVNGADDHAAQFVFSLGPPVLWLSAIMDPLDRRLPAMQFFVFPFVIVALAVAFVVRYFKAISPAPERLRRRWSVPVWAPRSFKSLLAALVWKHGREVLPISLRIFGIAVLMSLLAGFSTESQRSGRGLEAGLTTLVAFASCGGVVLAVLIGAGTFMEDLQPGVNTFWRSRPVSAGQWFVTKYAVGLAAVLATICLPALVSANFLHPEFGGEFLVMCLVLAGAVYSFTVAATCLVRNTMHAGVLGAGAAGIVYAIVEALAGSGFEPGGLRAPLSALSAAFALAFLAATALSWWAAVRDFSIAGR